MQLFCVVLFFACVGVFLCCGVVGAWLQLGHD